MCKPSSAQRRLQAAIADREGNEATDQTRSNTDERKGLVLIRVKSVFNPLACNCRTLGAAFRN